MQLDPELTRRLQKLKMNMLQHQEMISAPERRPLQGEVTNTRPWPGATTDNTTNKTSIQSAPQRQPGGHTVPSRHQPASSKLTQQVPAGQSPPPVLGEFIFDSTGLGGQQQIPLAATGGSHQYYVPTPPGGYSSSCAPAFGMWQHAPSGAGPVPSDYPSGRFSFWPQNDENWLPHDGGSAAAAFQPPEQHLSMQSALGNYSGGGDSYVRLPAGPTPPPPSHFCVRGRPFLGLQRPASVQLLNAGPSDGGSYSVSQQPAYHDAIVAGSYAKAPVAKYYAPPPSGPHFSDCSRSQPSSRPHATAESSFAALAAEQQAQRQRHTFVADGHAGFGWQPDSSRPDVRGAFCNDPSQPTARLPLGSHRPPLPHGPSYDSARKQQARRTVYVCDIDSAVKEAALANLFAQCGKIVDCRLCSDPNSALRFAFIEFSAEAAVGQALRLTGAKLGVCPVRVIRSRTAMQPVNRELLPRSGEERERCARTVYVANVDERLDAADVSRFFSKFCGDITAMRLLRSTRNSTQIAFVEFESAEAAAEALQCSGALLGSLLIRVSPSKTPIRSQE